jgi:hypothetical protein
MIIQELRERDMGVEIYINPLRNARFQGDYWVKIFGEKHKSLREDGVVAHSSWQTSLGLAICRAVENLIDTHGDKNSPCSKIFPHFHTTEDR